MFEFEIMNICLESDFEKKEKMLDDLLNSMSENQKDNCIFNIFFNLYSKYQDGFLENENLIFKVIDQSYDKNIYTTMFSVNKCDELLKKSIDKYYDNLNIDVLMSLLATKNDTENIDKLISMGSLNKIKDYEFIEQISKFGDFSFNKYKSILLDNVKNFKTDKTVRVILENSFINNNLSGLDFVFKNYQIDPYIIKNYFLCSVRRKDNVCFNYFFKNFKENFDNNIFFEAIKYNKVDYCEMFLKDCSIDKSDLILFKDLNFINSLFKNKSDTGKYLFFAFDEKELLDYLNLLLPNNNNVNKIYEEYIDIKFKHQIKKELFGQRDYIKNKRKI